MPKHKWLYADLHDGGEYPRPAQKCARCGLVRRQYHGGWYYPAPGYDAALDVWITDTEPPCQPATRPADVVESTA